MATVISLDTDSEDDKEVKVVQECNVDLRESIVADDEAEGSTATIRSMAEYEIEDDAYRGILSSAPSPWTNCQLSEHAILESSRVRCWNCPSLRTWTEEAETALRRKKKKKKGSTPHPEQSKRVLGRRPMNHTFQCQCDFNPFCLWSLGGVMDIHLQRADEAALKGRSLTAHTKTVVINVESDGNQGDTSPVCDESLVEDMDEEKKERTIRAECDASAGRGSNRLYETPSDFPPSTKALGFDFSLDELDHTKPGSLYSEHTRKELLSLRKTEVVSSETVMAYAQHVVLRNSDDEDISPEGYMGRIVEWHDSIVFPNPLVSELPQNSLTLTIALPSGLSNLGATCYLNTQLQCLARNPVFLEGILSWRRSSGGSENVMDSVLSNLQVLLARLTSGSQATVTAEEFTSTLGLEANVMQDPNEFARLLFERMHESFQQSTDNHLEGSDTLPTLLPRLFQGVLAYETTCSACMSITSIEENFMDINLPLLDAGMQSDKQSDAQCDLESCIDQYVCAEELAGENQYWCESCQAKRDASRKVVFRSLPPVLNLQLSRYIFDRKKLMKKKLMKKVLLPRVLKLPGSTSNYHLCAVMNHQGTSAYRGHYVAEAMDWHSGVWFEFNDENVVVLPNGPSCAYSPKESTKTAATRSPKGSQDAYNMYYVEETFLATKTILALRNMDRSPVFGVTSNDVAPSSPLGTVAIERITRYGLVSEMCLRDGMLRQRMKRRQAALLRLFSEHLTEATPKPSNAVWVDGPSLRSYLASGTELIHLARTPLCQHRMGLHPRVARKGKLLPMPLYRALIELSQKEQLSEENEISDVDVEPIIPNKNLRCELCSSGYVRDLKAKKDLVELLVALQGDLNPRVSSSRKISGVTFFVSRRFITKFREIVGAVVKNFDKMPEGLDGVDLSQFSNVSSSHEASPTIDVFVNTSILCDSLLCSRTVNKRQVSVVPEEVWYRIKRVFPEAIELRAANSLSDQLCATCRSRAEMSEKLQQWGAACSNKLPRRKAGWKQDSGNVYFCMPREQVKRLHDACRIAARVKANVADVVAKLKESCFPGHSSLQGVQTASMPDAVSRIVASWRPSDLLCECHTRVKSPLVFSPTDETESNGERIWSPSRMVDVIAKDDYVAFLEVLVELHGVLFAAKRAGEDADDNGPSNDLFQVLEAKFSHPKLSVVRENGRSSEGDMLFCQSGKETKHVQVVPERCADIHCNTNCLEMMRTKSLCRASNNSKSTPVPPSMESNDNEVEIIAQRAATKDEISLRVGLVKSSVSIESAIADLLKEEGEQSTKDEQAEVLRRSGRKRKRRFSLGVLEREEIVVARPDSNLAVLRLQMSEKFPEFRLDQPLKLVVLAPLLVGRSAENCLIVDLPFELKEAVLLDLLKAKDVNAETLNGGVIIVWKDLAADQPTGKSRRANKLANEELMGALLEVATFSPDEKEGFQRSGSRQIETGFSGTLLHSTRAKATEEDDTDEGMSNKPLISSQASLKRKLDGGQVEIVIDSCDSADEGPGKSHDREIRGSPRQIGVNALHEVAFARME